MQSFRKVTLAVVCAAAAPLALADLVQPTERQADLIASVFASESYTVQRLDVGPMPASGSASVQVQLGTTAATLQLVASTVRSATSTLTVVDETGTHVMPLPPSAVVRGAVAGLPGAVFAGVMTEEGLMGAVILPDGQTWSIEPLSKADPGAPASDHVVFHGSSVVLPQFECGGALPVPQSVALQAASRVNIGADRPGVLAYGKNPPATAEPATRASGTTDLLGYDERQDGPTADRVGELFRVQVAIESDRFFTAANANNVTNTTNAIDAVMAIVDTIYSRDVLTDIVVEDYLIRVNTDPYTSTDAGTLLDSFRDEWEGPQRARRRDHNHLFTGRNLNGGTIGVAWVGAACGSLRYGLSEVTFTGSTSNRAGLVSHEAGHNLGANHCDGNGDCHIMCSGFGGCNGLGGPRFGAGEIAELTAFISRASCIEDVVPPQIGLDLPVSDALFSGAFASFWDGPAISAQNPAPSINTAPPVPTPTDNQAIQIPSGRNVATQPLATNELNGALGGVRFWVYTAFSTNGSLVLEYLPDGQTTWIVMQTLTANNLPAEAFASVAIEFPAAVLTQATSFRFRSTSTIGTWYLDDVYFGAVAVQNWDPRIVKDFETGQAGFNADPDFKVTTNASVVNEFALSFHGSNALSLAGAGRLELGPIDGPALFGTTPGRLRLAVKSPGVPAGSTLEIRTRQLAGETVVATLTAPILGPEGLGYLTTDLPQSVQGTAPFTLALVTAPGAGAWLLDDLTVATTITDEFCYADLDASGAFDIFDILSYFTFAGSGAAVADWDGSGSFNIFDILLFFNDFGTQRCD